jgi:L-iditol 2-dehydrogenase
MNTMRASVLLGKGELIVEERPIPVPDPDQVLVKVAAVGVCGSDVHYFREGRIGDFIVKQPLILGHEASGVITAVGSEVSPDRIGQRVAIEPQRPCGHCEQCRKGAYNLCPNIQFYATPPIDGAFCEYVLIQSDFAYRIPDEMSFEAAALCEPLSVGIAAARKARIVPGSSVLIAGAGPIGIICAQTAKAFGASEIIMTDIVPEKRARALTYGATRVMDPMTEEVAGLGVDAFIDASGAESAVASGIMAVGPGGAAVLVGMGKSEMTLNVSQIANLEINVTGIFRYTGTWPVAIELVANQIVDLDSLVTAKFDLDHIREALNSDHDPMNLKSIVYPNG